jgi:hypothetical protein
MAESIRCPHCGKNYVLKPELAGKQVRCRQCQKPFTVQAPKPPDEGLEEPIVLSLATPEPPARTGAFPNANAHQNLANGPAIAPPGQEETLAVGTVLPLRGETALGPVVARRRSQAGNAWWRQLLERLLARKLTAAVAITSLGLLFVFVLLLFTTGLSWFFVVPSLAGGGLVGMGLLLPIPGRPKRAGPWLGPSAARIAIGSGVFGLVFAVLFVIMIVTGASGHPVHRMIGLSDNNAPLLLVGVMGTTGGCFIACIITLLLSGGWAVARQYGFLRIANFLYLGASPIILLVLCACGMTSKWMHAGPPVAYQPPAPRMNRDTNMPPGWPSNQPQPYPNQASQGNDPMRPRADPMWPGADHMRPGSGRMPAGPSMGPRGGSMVMPPGLTNPNNPEFYRAVLAELRSSDVNHRRIAVTLLSHVPPKELREEIVKALEPLVHDSDETLRCESLKALDVWSTGDIVPIAIEALGDRDTWVRDGAIAVLAKRKDPRAIEPLIALLSDPMNSDAAGCLEQLGPKVEDAVLARYDGGNNHARRFIIQILGAVATEKGIAKLRQIAADKSDFSSAAYARHMLMRRGERVN